MASRTFSASQVCQIVTGDDGDLDYVFPGSDDELDTSLEDSDLEDIDHLESEIDDRTEAETDLATVRSNSSTSEGSDAESQGSGVEREGGGAGGRGGSAVGRGSARGRGGSAVGRGGARGRGRGTGDRGGSAGGRGSSARSRGRGVRGHDHGSDQDGPAGENSWSDTGSSVNVEPFTMDVGPTIPLGEDPSDIFMTFFTPQLLEYIVTETNRFACQYLSATHEGEGPPPTWETNAEEMKAYLGFAILMGINRLPDLYDYWSTDEVFHYYPIASRIPRKRFLEMARFLHFANNDDIVPRGEPGHDRLAKVRPVIEMVRESFLANYNPHCENSVDEAMIRFKGRSTLKQYMPKKPTKRGLKVWVRADSHNGYICDLDVYTGKDDSRETALGSKVVKKLSRELVGGNYHLYFDNFFSSVPLLEDLLEDGIYACGTFRKDRR